MQVQEFEETHEAPSSHGYIYTSTDTLVYHPQSQGNQAHDQSFDQTQEQIPMGTYNDPMGTHPPYAVYEQHASYVENYGQGQIFWATRWRQLQICVFSVHVDQKKYH